MSTRSYIVLKKGNEYRACWVHWDGRNHGDTFRHMSNIEVMDLWFMLGMMASRNDQAWLEHFYTEAEWKLRVKECVEECLEKGESPHYESCMCGQTTAHYPIAPDEYDHKATTRTIAVFQSPELGRSLYDLIRHAEKGPHGKTLGKPLDTDVELGWVFDIETNEVWRSWYSYKNWEWQKMASRKRKT